MASDRIEPIDNGAPTETVVENDVSEVEKNLRGTNEVISGWLNSVTEGVDLFLVGKKITNSEKTSNIILENTTYSRESQNLVNLTSINVQPRFPNLEAYWNLKFTNYDDTPTSIQTDRGYARQTPRDKNYAATVGLFRKLNNVRIAFQPRIELQDPLRISHSLAFESVLPYKNFQLNPKFQLFASATKGVGLFQAVNVNFKLKNEYSLTLINEGEYEDKIHKLSVTNGLALGKILTETSAISYGLNFYSHNRDNYHLDAYSLSVTWSQIIYKKLLDYQLTPHLDFVESENFHGFFGLVFGLNLRF